MFGLPLSCRESPKNTTADPMAPTSQPVICRNQSSLPRFGPVASPFGQIPWKTRATADPERLPSYLDLIFVSRAIERVGDHATSIAEDAFWRDQASDIRHTYRDSVI